MAGRLSRPLCAALLAVALCPASFAQQETDPEDAKRVLVVMNKASNDSLQVGTYYRSKRKIPRENVLFIDVSRTEEISNGEYKSGIETPVRDAIKKSKNKSDFIVLTKRGVYESNTAQAQAASINELYGLGYDFDTHYAERINAVTIADVVRVANKYLTHYVCVVATPKPEENAEATGE